jgi:hypothetical protein
MIKERLVASTSSPELRRSAKVEETEDGRSLRVDDGGDERDSCTFGDGLTPRLSIERTESASDQAYQAGIG